MKYKMENLMPRGDLSEILEEYEKAEKKDKENINLEEKILENSKDSIVNISVDDLMDNPNNHFHQIDGEQWEEFVGSIKEIGIINPCIVRPKEGKFEILAGHNRVRGAREAGLKEVPCMVSDVDDVQASIIVAVTNNQREGTTELEWGWAYRNTYEAIKRQAGRHKKEDEKNVSHDGTHLRSDEILAKKYGIGRNTINRKIRLTYLTPQIYDMYDKKEINQKIAIDLSYLPEINQDQLVAVYEAEHVIITEEVARELKNRAQHEKLSINNVLEICKGIGGVEIKKPARAKKYSVDETLFPAEMKKEYRDTYIAKALQYVLENNIKLEMGDE